MSALSYESVLTALRSQAKANGVVLLIFRTGEPIFVLANMDTPTSEALGATLCELGARLGEELKA